MQYRTLGTTGISVSLLGYGAWALGKQGWPGVDKREAIATLEAAIKHGINLFDTAPIYGFGRSEHLLGEVLRGHRSKVVLATKCGLRWDKRGKVTHDLSREAILRDIEASLSRLSTEYIDLYQTHWPDPATPFDETLETLCDLVAQGVVKHIGLCNATVPLIEQALQQIRIASVQNQYNLLQRDAEQEVLPFCREKNIGFLCYSPLAQGLLAGTVPEKFVPGRHDIRRLNPLWCDPQTLCNAIAYVRRLSHPPAAAALRFLAAQEGVSSILVSMTRRKHLEENLQYLEQSDRADYPVTF